MTWIILLLIIFSFIAMVFPLVPSHHWLFNIFTYPRLQILGIQLATIIFTPLAFGWHYWTVLVVILLTGNCVLILKIVRPYTQFGKKELFDLEEEATVKVSLKVLIWNVYQFNRNSKAFLQLVKQQQPRVILICEANQWWVDQLAEIKKTYPYHLEAPLENTYGMCLYSQYPFATASVEHLLREDVPSIKATLILAQGIKITIFGVHPIPPYPAYSASKAPKDAELLLIAKEVNNTPNPCIVMGDMNDVAWSSATLAFQKISRLLDPRRGRGIIPTFHAKIPLARIPIDQIFCSTEFRLVAMQRMPAMGSDHFPLLVELPLTNNPKAQPTPPMEKAQPKDWKLTEEKIEEGQALAVDTN